jgi:hypothetical protein
LAGVPGGAAQFGVSLVIGVGTAYFGYQAYESFSRGDIFNGVLHVVSAVVPGGGYLVAGLIRTVFQDVPALYSDITSGDEARAHRAWGILTGMVVVAAAAGVATKGVGAVARLARGGAAVPAAGAFGAHDVAFGLTHAGGRAGVLTEFAGGATPGTQAPLASATQSMARGAARNAAIASDTLAFAASRLRATGGFLRFNLAGLDVRAALTRGSSQYGSVTSVELRGVLNDPFLRSRTTFHRGGATLTPAQVEALAQQ